MIAVRAVRSLFEVAWWITLEVWERFAGPLVCHLENDDPRWGG